MKKTEIRTDIPEQFYREAPGTGYPVCVYTVGELKEALKKLPDDIKIRQGFDYGVQIIVFNVGYDNTHLGFEDCELSDSDDAEDE